MRKTLTKKQLQTRCARAERRNRELYQMVNTLYAALHESIMIASELSRMIPMPNYDYSKGM